MGQLTREEVSENFASKLSELLVARGISHQQFADDLGVFKSRIDSYTRGNAALPPLDFAIAIAEELGISLDYLCGVGEVHELRSSESNPSTILLNILIAARDAGMTITTNGEKVEISTNNFYISNFLAKAQGISGIRELKRLAEMYGDVRLLNGQLVHRSDYEMALKDNYIFGDITDEQREEMPEECQQLINARRHEWEQTGGHPKKYLPEGWDEQ